MMAGAFSFDQKYLEKSAGFVKGIQIIGTIALTSKSLFINRDSFLQLFFQLW
jgi:hypothetical protein